MCQCRWCLIWVRYQRWWQQSTRPLQTLSPQMASPSEPGHAWFQGSGCLRHQWQLWKCEVSPLRLIDVATRGRSQKPISMDKHNVVPVLKFWSTVHNCSSALCCPRTERWISSCSSELLYSVRMVDRESVTRAAKHLYCFCDDDAHVTV